MSENDQERLCIFCKGNPEQQHSTAPFHICDPCKEMVRAWVPARDFMSTATPPPQPPGGTPEGLRKVEHSMSCPFPEGCTCGASKFNAVNAALAAALAEVARLQGDKTNMLEELDVRGAEMQRLRAELEQTRRDRDNWKASAEVRAHERKIACERLTAAEERADGAERKCRGFYDGVCAALSLLEHQDCTPENPQLIDGIKALIASRDTAQRERDGEKAIVDWLERVALTRDSQSVTLQWVNPDDHSEYIRMEITHHIPLDEFYASETLRQAIASHQQEITP